MPHGIPMPKPRQSGITGVDDEDEDGDADGDGDHEPLGLAPRSSSLGSASTLAAATSGQAMLPPRTASLSANGAVSPSTRSHLAPLVKARSDSLAIPADGDTSSSLAASSGLSRSTEDVFRDRNDSVARAALPATAIANRAAKKGPPPVPPAGGMLATSPGRMGGSFKKPAAPLPPQAQAQATAPAPAAAPAVDPHYEEPTKFASLIAESCRKEKAKPPPPNLDLLSAAIKRKTSDAGEAGYSPKKGLGPNGPEYDAIVPGSGGQLASAVGGADQEEEEPRAGGRGGDSSRGSGGHVLHYAQPSPEEAMPPNARIGTILIADKDDDNGGGGGGDDDDDDDDDARVDEGNGNAAAESTSSSMSAGWQEKLNAGHQGNGPSGGSTLMPAKRPLTATRSSPVPVPGAGGGSGAGVAPRPMPKPKPKPKPKPAAAAAGAPAGEWTAESARTLRRSTSDPASQIGNRAAKPVPMPKPRPSLPTSTGEGVPNVRRPVPRPKPKTLPRPAMKPMAGAGAGTGAPGGAARPPPVAAKPAAKNRTLAQPSPSPAVNRQSTGYGDSEA